MGVVDATDVVGIPVQGNIYKSVGIIVGDRIVNINPVPGNIRDICYQ